MKKIKKIICIVLIALLILIVVFIIAAAITKGQNRRTPEGGINESIMVDINGSKQWISIYGEDIDNPALLFLHGGPGSANSVQAYQLSKKWGDIYTVVFWDQRNCGLSYSGKEDSLSADIFMQDGKEMTEFILDYLGKDKLVLMGHSWGSMFGANLALVYPEYYECYIGVGQVIDITENEYAFKEAALQWTSDNDKLYQLAESLDPDNIDVKYIRARNKLLTKYNHGFSYRYCDFNTAFVYASNPYYSISDYFTYVKSIINLMDDDSQYRYFSNYGLAPLSLKGQTNYSVPYFNVNGDLDYQANYELAQQYFEQVNAPYKKLYMMENTDHGLCLTRTEAFSEILHEISLELKDVK